MIQKEALERLYVREGKSMQEIADILQCSLHKVAYWMDGHSISRRSRSEAMYRKHNPDGDPFKFVEPRTLKDAELFGIGIGLYWGEGNKANKNSVRLGNTDPMLIKRFMEFLIRFFDIDKSDMKFGLQIFTDIDTNKAMRFWQKELGVWRSQFMKPTITISGSIGKYRHKSKYGVVTLHYHNKKLRDLLVNLLPR